MVNLAPLLLLIAQLFQILSVAVMVRPTLINALLTRTESSLPLQVLVLLQALLHLAPAAALLVPYKVHVVEMGVPFTILVQETLYNAMVQEKMF